MDYETAYKEALAKAKGIVRYYKEHNRDEAAIEDFREVFPELAESEDERMKQSILGFLEELSKLGKNTNFDKWSKSDCANWIAWLEKQGEQKPIDKIQFGKKYKCIASPRYTTFMIGEIYKPEDKFLCSLMNFCYTCFEPIEDGEQKSADKIEPKFKVGDWIVDNRTGVVHYIAKIKGTVDGCYYVLGYDKGLLHIDNESDYHLWTIEDAKDGDVLYSPCLSLLWIFKSKDTVYCGCNLNYNDGAFCGEGYFERPTDAISATKEQRDLLFQKIKDAGYEWDAEKKELKKIAKFKVGDTIRLKNSRAKFTIVSISNGRYYFKGSSIDIIACDRDYYKLVVPKLSNLEINGEKWSEEDEFCMNTILNILEQLKGQSPYEEDDTAEKCINFLKRKLKK